MKNTAKPTVQNQGKVVVERTHAYGCDEVLVALPDGRVELALSSAAALKLIKAWARRNGNKMALRFVQVEWRDGSAPEAQRAVVKVGA